MKKNIRIVVVILLALSMLSLFASCAGRSAPQKGESLEDKFKTAVWSYATAYCGLNYKDVQSVTTNLTTVTVDGDTYTGKGKVNIRDAYGDNYTANVTAVYKYEDGKFRKVSVDIGTPIKN